MVRKRAVERNRRISGCKKQIFGRKEQILGRGQSDQEASVPLGGLLEWMISSINMEN
jgi:hypothetical protein